MNGKVLLLITVCWWPTTPLKTRWKKGSVQQKRGEEVEDTRELTAASAQCLFPLSCSVALDKERKQRKESEMVDGNLWTQLFHTPHSPALKSTQNAVLCPLVLLPQQCGGWLHVSSQLSFMCLVPGSGPNVQTALKETYLCLPMSLSPLNF